MINGCTPEVKCYFWHRCRRLTSPNFKAEVTEGNMQPICTDCAWELHDQCDGNIEVVD